MNFNVKKIGSFFKIMNVKVLYPKKATKNLKNVPSYFGNYKVTSNEIMNLKVLYPKKATKNLKNLPSFFGLY